MSLEENSKELQFLLTAKANHLKASLDVALGNADEKDKVLIQKVSLILRRGMKMKIILLAGNANVGKTSTMNIVYDRLIREGAILDKGTPPEQSEKRKKDFECVLLYKGQKSGGSF